VAACGDDRSNPPYRPARSSLPGRALVPRSQFGSKKRNAAPPRVAGALRGGGGGTGSQEADRKARVASQRRALGEPAQNPASQPRGGVAARAGARAGEAAAAAGRAVRAAVASEQRRPELLLPVPFPRQRPLFFRVLPRRCEFLRLV
jgi:hypothetical protein